MKARESSEPQPLYNIPHICLQVVLMSLPYADKKFLLFAISCPLLDGRILFLFLVFHYVYIILKKQIKLQRMHVARTTEHNIKISPIITLQ